MSTISFRLQYTFLDPITTLRLDPLLSLKDLEISQLAHHLRPIFGLVFIGPRPKHSLTTLPFLKGGLIPNL